MRYLEIKEKDYKSAGTGLYRRSLQWIKENIPPRQQNRVAVAVGAAESGFSSNLKKDGAIMRADTFCALLCLFGAEIFFPDEDKPVQAAQDLTEKENSHLKKENELLKQLVAEKERIIRMYEKTFDASPRA